VAKLKKTILIVDDEAPSRDLLREILAPAGYQVLEASDGQEALEMVLQKKPDLLITDRAMPGLGGLELLKELQEKKISLPAIMVSGYGEESFWNQAIGYGARDYILKPFQETQVLEVIQKIFSGEKSR
jgi:YesN/AraC family two-component response regulator